MSLDLLLHQCELSAREIGCTASAGACELSELLSTQKRLSLARQLHDFASMRITKFIVHTSAGSNSFGSASCSDYDHLSYRAGTSLFGDFVLDDNHLASVIISNEPGTPPLSADLRLKPTGYAAKEAALQLQGFHCHGCNAELKREWDVARLGYSWDAARFCHYSGLYYCRNCHEYRISPIPARIVHEWDSRKYPVSNLAFATLTTLESSPVLCLSAINPQVYEDVAALNIARSVRVEVIAAREALRGCPDIDQLVRSYCDDRGIQAYYFESSEFWSLKDLVNLHGAQPVRHVAARYVRDTPLVLRLRALLALLIEHVTKICVPCKLKAAKRCAICNSASRFFSFDRKRAARCQRCNTFFHKECLAKADGCPSCYSE